MITLSILIVIALIIAVVILIVIVQVIQSSCDVAVRRIDKKK